MRPDAISMIVILFIVVAIFGPKNLPKLGEMFGKAIREFKGVKDSLPSHDDFSLDDDEKPRPRKPHEEA